jgi:hypothetical protein
MMRSIIATCILAIAASVALASEPIAALATEYDEAGGARAAVLIELHDGPCELSARELSEAGVTIPREALRSARWTAWAIGQAAEPERVAGCWVLWQGHVVVLWADRTVTPVPAGSFTTPSAARERVDRLRRRGSV